MTQTNSRQRVKVDTIGTKGMETLFEAYRNEDINTFRNTCIGIIQKSAGDSLKKDTFTSILLKATSKDFMVTKVTNYLMAGQGLGV
jgi:hypothetical protein